MRSSDQENETNETIKRDWSAKSPLQWTFTLTFWYRQARESVRCGAHEIKGTHHHKQLIAELGSLCRCPNNVHDDGG